MISRHSLAGGILLGGIIGAACDITYALVFSASRGVPPLRLLQSVASGLLGSAAYTGGVPTAVLGLVLHFLIVIAAAALFVGTSRRVPWLVQHPVIAGACFGLGIFLVMNFVVVPLSAFPHTLVFPPVVLISGLLVHMFLVGVPIALCARAIRPAPAVPRAR